MEEERIAISRQRSRRISLAMVQVFLGATMVVLTIGWPFSYSFTEGQHVFYNPSRELIGRLLTLTGLGLAVFIAGIVQLAISIRSR